MTDTAKKTVDHAEQKETAAMTNKLKSEKSELETGQATEGAKPMSEEEAKNPTKLEVVCNEELDEEEREFNALRLDLPGVQGASAAGIVNINVSKMPIKNEFFRTHPTFRSENAIVDIEVGMERTFFAVTKEMVVALAGIGITVTDHVLYLTVTSRGAVQIIPVRCPDVGGDQNEYHRTKELGLREGIHRWVRFFTDQENRCYKVFPAPEGGFGEPQFPELKPAKIFRLGFRAKGRLIDTTEHPAFLKWAARDDADKKSK
jgi:hypothetical protein